MTLTKRTEVSAVLGEEFYDLIDALGVKEAFDLGECLCDNCAEAVSPSNVSLVFPKNGSQVAFLCDKPMCMLSYGALDG